MRMKGMLAATSLAALLAGCTSMPGTLRSPAAAVATDTGDVDAAPARKGRHAVADDGGEDRPTGRAVPSPREIFDFRPSGSKADAWRAPFVIDTDDGPLRAEMRRSNEEMRKFREEQARQAKSPKAADAAAKTNAMACGEQDVADGKPGCPHPRAMRKAPDLTAKDPLAIDR